ncbi:holo-ACP synthase [Methanoplanus endosymbiosus]|uniref:Holo-ACP synthase n=1 Tax=Methanoplanus endosymbiosus TaxID=33865 RepID=A0A9E7PQD3_9EURY|nr:holo-ACP synthase [Methanoplanus endosymbiosus]UUX93069.1 holo-ACP synthase [Methanoplanus endosymbiosus]
MEIGVDIIDIHRFDEDLINNKAFIEKVFTDNEIRYCMSHGHPAQHLAVRFAAKEAVIKAVAPSGLVPDMRDIEVTNEDSGIPNVRILTKEGQKFEFKISLSHSQSQAVAFVIAERSTKNLIFLDSVKKSGPDHFQS